MSFQKQHLGVCAAGIQTSRKSLGKLFHLFFDPRPGVDADGSGMIDYTEFLAATLDRCARLFSPQGREGLCEGETRIEEQRFSPVFNRDDSTPPFVIPIEELLVPASTWQCQEVLPARGRLLQCLQ